MIVSKVKRTSARGGQRNVASRVRPAVWSGGAVTIVVVVAAVLVGAGGLDAHRSAGDARHGRSLSPPGATAITTTTTTTTTPVPAPPYPIEDETITLFDPTRDTPARGDAPATSGRLLVTDIRRPIGPTGPLPLVVFAHGWNSNPTVYETLLDAWAAAGYLVAAPVFPDSANTLPGSPVSNYPEQAFDLSFIISSLLGGRAGPVDPTRIAVAGHSDGGTDVALLALNPAYSDPRVRAYLSLSGEIPAGVPGPWGVATTGSLLVAVGTDDQYGLYPRASEVFETASTTAKVLLTVTGGDHLDMYIGSSSAAVALRAETVRFLNEALRPTALSSTQLVAALEPSGDPTLTVSGG